MSEVCSDVYTFPQPATTCWFNAIIMTLLYSQGMRNAIMSHMDSWEPKSDKIAVIYDTITDIIVNRYKNMDKREIPQDEVETLYPEAILKALHAHDKHVFDINPNVAEGLGTPTYKSQTYTAKMLDLMGMDKSVLYLSDSSSASITKRKVKLLYKKNPTTPEVIVYSTTLPVIDKQIASGNNTPIVDKHTRKQLGLFWHGNSSKPPYITLGDDKKTKYIFDSMIMTNANKYVCSRGHQIAGLTCENNRFMYNGWLGYTSDSGMKDATHRMAACRLMPYDWLSEDTDFCINTRMCKLDTVDVRQGDIHKTNLCFNYQKGTRRYFLVREDLYNRKQTKEIPVKQLKNSLYKLAKKEGSSLCPHQWHYSKAMNACINCGKGVAFDAKKQICYDPVTKGYRIAKKVLRLNNDVKKVKLPKRKATSSSAKSKADCKRGFELNSKTGKCVKKCDKGSERNPSTGRCVKSKSKTKSTKITKPKTKKAECANGYEKSKITGNCVKACAPGTRRNKETGRCNKDKSAASVAKKQKKTAVRKGCEKGYEKSKITGNCVKKCAPGTKRNEKTGRCRST